MQSTILCWYHSPCNDGSAAAAALEYRLLDEYKRRGEEAPRIEFVPFTHGLSWDDPLKGEWIESNITPDTPVSAIYFVDIAISAVRMKQVLNHLRAIERLQSEEIPIVCIDHHKSALDRSEEIRSYCTDMDIRIAPGMSGATLAWSYFDSRFNNPIPTPGLLLYVADQDLWEWKLANSETINASLNTFDGRVASMRDELAAWMADPEGRLHYHMQRGEGITALVDQQVRKAAIHVQAHRMASGPMLLVANATSFTSELGNFLCTEHEETPQVVALLYTIQQDWVVRCSVRSVPGGDVSARMIAERYGGGGHEHAAGCRFSSIKAFRSALVELESVPLRAASES